MNSNEIERLCACPPRVGDVIKQARQARRLTLRHFANHIMKEDAAPIRPQYLLDIEVHPRIPAPHVPRELARVLEVDYDTLVAFAGAVDTVVRAYLEAQPQQTEAVIKLFCMAQQRGGTTGISCASALHVAVRAAHHSVPAF
jgi:hypothetical protein